MAILRLFKGGSLRETFVGFFVLIFHKKIFFFKDFLTPYMDCPIPRSDQMIRHRTDPTKGSDNPLGIANYMAVQV